MTETRKLAAILASDVVGYSRLAGVDEDRIRGPAPSGHAGEMRIVTRRPGARLR